MPCLKQRLRCEGGAPYLVHLGSILVALLITFNIAAGQSPANPQTVKTEIALSRGESDPSLNVANPASSWTAAYVDSAQGALAIDLVRRALASNAELAAVRIEIDRARARLRQAGLRPNPSVDFERQNGVFNRLVKARPRSDSLCRWNWRASAEGGLIWHRPHWKPPRPKLRIVNGGWQVKFVWLTPRLWRRCESWK